MITLLMSAINVDIIKMLIIECYATPISLVKSVYLYNNNQTLHQTERSNVQR